MRIVTVCLSSLLARIILCQHFLNKVLLCWPYCKTDTEGIWRQTLPENVEIVHYCTQLPLNIENLTQISVQTSCFQVMAEESATVVKAFIPTCGPLAWVVIIYCHLKQQTRIVLNSPSWYYYNKCMEFSEKNFYVDQPCGDISRLTDSSTSRNNSFLLYLIPSLLQPICPVTWLVIWACSSRVYNKQLHNIGFTHFPQKTGQLINNQLKNKPNKANGTVTKFKYNSCIVALSDVKQCNYRYFKILQSTT